MGLVSEQVGEQVNEQGMKTVSELLIALLTVLNQKLKQKGFVDESQKGVLSILKHLENGGQTRMQIVDEVDKELFEAIMKNEDIPYVIMEQSIGGEKKYLFVTKDTDAKKMETVWERFAAETKRGFYEQAPQEFLHNMEGREIAVSKGYSEVELEAFRLEAAKIGLTYSIVKNETDKSKYDIMYVPEDKKTADKIFLGMHFDFQGPDGRAYKDALEHSITAKDNIMRQVNAHTKGIMYIANPDDPSRFITIQDGVMVQHNLSPVKSKDRKGNEIITYKDEIRKTFPFGAREVTKAMRMMGKCVVVPEKEMTHICGLDSNMKAIAHPKETFEQEYKKVKEVLTERTDIYISFISRQKPKNIGKITSLSNIEAEKIPLLMRELADAGVQATLTGNDLAFTEIDKAAIESILDKVLYTEMDFIEKFEAKMFYEGRGPEGLSIKNPETDIYIVSGRNPELVIHVGQSGNLEVTENGRHKLNITKDNPMYEQSLKAMLESIEDPAVLTKDEMHQEPSERVRIIEERLSTKENEATRILETTYEERKARCVNSNPERGFEDAEFQAAHTEHTSHSVEVKYIDRTFTEKIQDMDFGQKRVERTIERNESI